MPPAANFTVRISRTLNIRVLCRAQAIATTASKCSCLSSVAQRHSWAPFLHEGATLALSRYGSALLKLFVPPCTCLLPRCVHCLRARSDSVECVPLPGPLGIRAVPQSFLCSAMPSAAPPTSPFMALPMQPLAVKAEARFPLGKLLPGVLLPENSSNELVHLSCFPHIQAPRQFFVPVAAFGNFYQQRETHFCDWSPQYESRFLCFFENKHCSLLERIRKRREQRCSLLEKAKK